MWRCPVARHPFDPVSFVFGGLALVAGIVVLVGGTLIDEARVMLPAGLIALGVALLVKVVGGRRNDVGPAAFAGGAGAVDWDAGDDRFGTVPYDPTAGADSDLDRLFAPVDDVLSTWDADRATTTAPDGGTPGGDDTVADPDLTGIGDGATPPDVPLADDKAGEPAAEPGDEAGEPAAEPGDEAGEPAAEPGDEAGEPDQGAPDAGQPDGDGTERGDMGEDGEPRRPTET
jgi:hypothetical protein